MDEINYIEGVEVKLGELVPQIRNAEKQYALWAYMRGQRIIAYLYRVNAVRWRVVMAGYPVSLFHDAQRAVGAIEGRELRRTVPLERAGKLLVRMERLAKPVSLRTLSRWAQEGRLKARKIRAKGRGGEWRVRLADLDTFVPPRRGHV